MCFPRKPWLGHYNATRGEWLNAYRGAREGYRRLERADPSVSAIEWKADLIVWHDRRAHDPLTVSVKSRLFVKKFLAEL